MTHKPVCPGFAISLTLMLLALMIAMPAQAQTPPYQADIQTGLPTAPQAPLAPDCTTVPANPFVNCSFETGSFASWVTTDLTTPFLALDVGAAGVSPGFGFFTSAPTQGSFAALHGFDGDGPGTIRVCQDVVLPAGALLEFDYRAAWNMTFGATLDRTFDVNVEPAGGGANLFNQEILRAVAPTVNLDTGPLQAAVDISAAGKGARRVCFDADIPQNFTGPGFFQLDNVSVTGMAEADLAVTKGSNDLKPGYQDTITFTVSVRNNGPDDADDVEITDALPAGLTFAGASATQGAYNPVTGLWDVGTITNGDTAILTLDATVETLDPATNTALITNSAAIDPDGSNNSASVTVTPRAADLSIDKTVDIADPAIGDLVTFTIEISHLDGADVIGTRVEDQLPNGLSYVSHAATQGTYNAATGSWLVGSLTEGQTETLTITAEVLASGAITNTAFIAFASEPDPFPGDNTDAASLNAEAADLEVTKTVTAFATDNGTITATFEVTVANEGPSATGGVVVTDNLSPDMSLESASVSQGTLVTAPPVLTWGVGTLAVGASATLTVTVTVPTDGSLVNTAEVTAADLPDPDSDPGDGQGDDFALATAAPRVVPDFVPGAGPGGVLERGDRFTADLALTKEVAVEGGSAIYTITVTNLGPQSTAKVEVSDHLPDCLSYVSSSADRGAYDPATWIWSVGEVKVGETVTLEIVTTIGATCEGDVVNTATITASSLPDPGDFFNLFDEPAIANNSDEATFTASSGRVLDGRRFALGTNYPNPFNPETVIPYSVAEVSHVSIKVYDLLGRAVATLVDGTMSPGVHEVRFEAGYLPTGMYLVRMEAAGVVETMRVTLMK